MCDSKRIVTENERNAIFTVLTPEEFLLLGRSLNDLCTEYKKEGSLPLDTVIPILGICPIIQNTHDIDAKLETILDRCKYADKVQSIEDFFEYELQHDHI